MDNKIRKTIENIANKMSKLPQPIHLFAVCSGGVTVAKSLVQALRKKGIVADNYEVWTNTINGKKTVVKCKGAICKTNFKQDNYSGTAVIVEDVIWTGKSMPLIKKMLNKKNRKKVYIASLLDFNHKADFSFFS